MTCAKSRVMRRRSVLAPRSVDEEFVNAGWGKSVKSWVGIWLVWPLETWSDAIRSARLVPAIIAMVGGLLLYWAQRRNTRKRSPCPVATR
jgi:hypothetical protein